MPSESSAKYAIINMSFIAIGLQDRQRIGDILRYSSETYYRVMIGYCISTIKSS